MTTIVSNGHGYPSFHSIDALLGAQNVKIGVTEQHELRVPDLSFHTRDSVGYTGSCHKAFGHNYLFGPRGKSTDSDDKDDADELECSASHHGIETHRTRKEHCGM